MNENGALIGRVLTKATYIGLVMNVLFPVIVLVVAVLVFSAEITNTGGLHLQNKPTVEMLFYVFIAVTVLDFAVAYFIRNHIPAVLIDSSAGSVNERFERSALKISLIIFTLNMSFVLYGIVLMLLGASIEVLMLFAALSMIGYQFLRPRRDYLEMMLNKIIDVHDHSRHG
jgi:hypothetical protein